MVGQTTVITTLAASRFIARLLIGILVSMQAAIAAAACPTLLTTTPGHERQAISISTMADQGRTGSMKSHGVAALRSDGLLTEYGSMQSELPTFCVAHCPVAAQMTISARAPTEHVALLTTLYNLPPRKDVPDPARQPANASDLQPGYVPPHAILHCCFRV